MKILGIDTSTKFLCLAIYNNSKIYGYNLEVGSKLSSFLAPSIEETLKAAKLKVGDIDYFACGIGPGSFTGLRVGLATVKGLSWALKKPIAAVSTLDILARNIKGIGGYIIPVIDAKRNLFYCGIYKVKNGVYRRVSPYMLLQAAELINKAEKGAVFLGDGLNLLRDRIITGIKGAQISDRDYWRVEPHNIIETALEKIKRGELTDSFKLKPLYLYPKECQIRTKAQQQESR